MRDKTGAAGEPSDSAARENPLTRINVGLKEMGTLLRDMSEKLRELEDKQNETRKHGGEAWNERENLLKNYFSIIRRVLDILDDCEHILEESQGAHFIFKKLEALIEERQILTMDVNEGDPFDARLHECEETVETEMHPPNAIVRVVGKGYVQAGGDGTPVVIRPARVHVSKKSS
jgi:molecular chaperone GrpE (heat shock protein)